MATFLSHFLEPVKYNKPNLRLVKFEPKKHKRGFPIVGFLSCLFSIIRPFKKQNIKPLAFISRLVILTSLKIALFGEKVANKDYTLFEEQGNFETFFEEYALMLHRPV